MTITDLSTAQKQAMLDLLILGMYADRNLASAEELCVQKLLGSLKFSSDFERDSFSDAAFTRVSRHTGSPEAVQAYANDIAAGFPALDQRQFVYGKLSELLTSDGRVTAEENQLLSAVKKAFQL